MFETHKAQTQTQTKRWKQMIHHILCPLAFGVTAWQKLLSQKKIKNKIKNAESTRNSSSSSGSSWKKNRRQDMGQWNTMQTSHTFSSHTIHYALASDCLSNREQTVACSNVPNVLPCATEPLKSLCLNKKNILLLLWMAWSNWWTEWAFSVQCCSPSWSQKWNHIVPVDDCEIQFRPK